MISIRLDASPDVLVVEERPWFLASIAVGVIVLTAIGIVSSWGQLSPLIRSVLVLWLIVATLVAVFAIRVVTVTLDRVRGRVRTVRRSVLGTRVETYDLGHLRRASVQASSSETGFSYRLYLDFDEAILEDIDPELVERQERSRRRGFRQTKPHEIPVTYYFNGDDDVRDVSRRINEWLMHSA